MLEAISVASRQLLVIDPFDDCEQLLPHLHASGWALHSCLLDELGELHGDVVLIRLQEEQLQRPQRLIRLMRSTPASWVAVLEARSLARKAVAELVEEWFFSAHTLPCETDAVLAALAHAQTATRLRNLQRERPSRFLGNSGGARTLRKMIESCALDTPLLLSGERGSGKTLLAQLVHERSRHAGQPLVCFDCAAQPSGELEARLFGGAAVEGVLAMAASGTLVLEGLAELSSTMQQRLLLHLQLQRHSSLRLLTISRGELEVAVRQGRFHEGLYRLLASQQLRTIPLRELRGDLLLLAEHFVKTYDVAIGRQARRFSNEAIDAMLEHSWPGNVRELCHRVRRALVLAHGRQIVARDLGLMMTQGGNDVVVTLADYILRAERQALDDVLERYSHNMSQAARSLGISRPTFYRLLHKHRLR